MGRGHRTNDEGIRQLRALLGDDVEVIVVPLPHWRGAGDVFHLMSIVSPVDRDLAVVYSPLMPIPFRERLLERGTTLVEVPDEEFDTMGANVLAVGPRRCVMVERQPPDARASRTGGRGGVRVCRPGNQPQGRRRPDLPDASARAERLASRPQARNRRQPVTIHRTPRRKPPGQPAPGCHGSTRVQAGERTREMSTRYVAFDIETAKILPEKVGDLLEHRPLGICCAAAIGSGESVATTWHGRTADVAPSPRMSRQEAQALVLDLQTLTSDRGCTLLTWNGLNFDFNILAEESGLWEECAALALAHVDMMFHVVCDRGHYVALGARRAGVPARRKDRRRLWAQRADPLGGRDAHDEVIRYNTRDVELSLEVAQASERAGAFRWVTRKGTIAEMALERGWLDVAGARALPLPDTSWMTDPPRRDNFFRWFPA